jgi:hypothetical protein
MAAIIKPTVGRKVWYRPTDYDHQTMLNDQKQPLDATIVYVHGDRLVNLSISDHNGRHHERTSVKLIQAEDSKPEGGGYCEWMPYQVGQAAKTQEAEVVAEAARRGFRGGSADASGP